MPDSNLVALPDRNERQQVGEVLTESIEAHFDEVIVFGLKGEEIHVKSSKTASRLKIIGALEIAKHHIWDGK